MKDLVIDFFGYLKVHKRYWLVPIILSLLIVSALVFVSQTAIVTAMYTIF